MGVCTHAHAHVFSFPRGLCVGIYATNSADACQYVITNAKVNVLLVENDLQLQKILSVKPKPKHCHPVSHPRGWVDANDRWGGEAGPVLGFSK